MSQANQDAVRSFQSLYRRKDAYFRTLFDGIDRLVAQDKDLASRLLAELGLPVTDAQGRSTEDSLETVRQYLDSGLPSFLSPNFYADIDFVRSQRIVAGAKLFDDADISDLLSFFDDRWLPSPYASFLAEPSTVPQVMERHWDKASSDKDEMLISEKLRLFLWGDQPKKWTLKDLEEYQNTAKYYILYCLVVANLKKRAKLEDDGVVIYNRKVSFSKGAESSGLRGDSRVRQISFAVSDADLHAARQNQHPVRGDRGGRLQS
jgi:hypothetical protein